MIYESIDLYEYFGLKRNSANGGFLQLYCASAIHEIKSKIRPCILIIPGGGYSFVSKREGEPIAIRYISCGYFAAVLEYSVNSAYPVPLAEACMAMIYLRENAKKFGIDDKHVAAVGFSAGGHLAGMLATMYAEEEIKRLLNKKVLSARPDAVVLSYAVLSMDETVTHHPTRMIISGNGKVAYDKLSIEKRVVVNGVPSFIWHTSDDNVVPVQNSILYASSCAKCGVPFDLHIFGKGGHGLSLCSDETHNQTPADYNSQSTGVWFTLSANWLSERGFKVRINNSATE